MSVTTTNNSQDNTEIVNIELGPVVSDEDMTNPSSEGQVDMLITRPLTIASSSATLCDLADKEKDGDKDTTPINEHPPPIPEHQPNGSVTPAPLSPSPENPKRQTSTRRRQPMRRPSDSHNRPPPPPAAGDIIGIFDPASVGGGGPLRRIETQRSERYQQEEREKAEREALGQPENGGGILKRFRSISVTTPGGRKRGITISSVLPTHAHEEEDEDNHDHDDDDSKNHSGRNHHGHGHHSWRQHMHVPILSPAISKTFSMTSLTSGGKDKEKSQYEVSFGDDKNNRSRSRSRSRSRDRKSKRRTSSDDSHSVDVKPQSRPGEGEERGEDEDIEEEEEYVYPDGGYGWVIVACCSTLAGCTMGYGMIYGTFLEYYETVFSNVNSTVLSLPGTAYQLGSCTASFLAGRMGDQYGFKRVLLVSSAITFIGMFSAGFCNFFWQLIITQGFITGFGQGFAIPLFMALPSQWFYKHRGMASGLSIGGAGLGGGIANLMSRQLLTAVGYKKTHIILACINTFFTIISIALIKTRPLSPEARGARDSNGEKTKRPWVDMNVIKTSAFWVFGLGLIATILGYATVFIYFTKWMKIHLPNEPGIIIVLPITVLAFTICVGRGLVGLVADLIGPINTTIVVFVGSGAIQLALWLTAKSLGGIMAFAIMFGLIAPGFLGIVPQVVIQIFGSANLATNVGLILLFTGPGNFISGPLGGAILDKSGGKDYTTLIVMSGCMQILGGLLTCYVRYKASTKLIQRV